MRGFQGWREHKFQAVGQKDYNTLRLQDMKWPGEWTMKRSKLLALSPLCHKHIWLDKKSILHNPFKYAWPLPGSLTMSLPAVTPYRQWSDSIAGYPGGGGCDLHLDTPCALLVVAFQSCTVQWRLDGISHLRPSTSAHIYALLLQRMPPWLTSVTSISIN